MISEQGLRVAETLNSGFDTFNTKNMELVKTHHESGRGIYAQSLPVTNWKAAKAIAGEMIEWINEENGNFKGNFPSAFAVAHAQVTDSKEPLQLFVVDAKMVEPKELEEGSKQTLANFFFEDQAIYNCEILEAPAKLTREVPERKINKTKDGKVEVDVEMVEKEVDNTISVPEGCMSFPHRDEKNVERKYRVKVRYQYYKQGLLGKKVSTFEGWVEGLKAHVIQHECDHFAGRNIFYS